MSYSPYAYNPQGTGTSESLVTNYTNNSVSVAIPQAQACSVNGSGKLVPLDVSNQASWQAFVGYAYIRIPASSTGPVVANGRLQNITTSYPVGTALYIGTDSNPTNIIPLVGVNGFTTGMMVIFLGVIVPNELVPAEKDIALFTEFIATL